MRRVARRGPLVAVVVGAAGLAAVAGIALQSRDGENGRRQDEAAVSPTSTQASPGVSAGAGASPLPEGAYEDPVHDESIEMVATDGSVVITISNNGDAVAPRVPLSVVVFDATGTRPAGSIDPASVDHPSGCVAYRGSDAGVYCPGATLALAPGETVVVTVPLTSTGTHLVRAAIDWGLEASDNPLSARFDRNPDNDLAETIVG